MKCLKRFLKSRPIFNEVVFTKGQLSFTKVANSPGSRGLVISHESLTDLGLSRISPGFLKDNSENTQISAKFLKDNLANNFMQVYLSLSLSFRMKGVL